MRVFNPGTTTKPEQPKEPRRRNRIKWRLTCPHCRCEFGITDDELHEAEVLTESRCWHTGTCPHCGQSIPYDGAERVSEKGEPLRSRRV